MLLPLLTLLTLPLALLATSVEQNHAKLVQLAANNNGLIKLDENLYNILTDPKRTWSASIHFTALDKRRRCTPCKEFDPSFNAIAKSWSTVPAPERDTHFFATLDFDDAMAVFQKIGLQSAPVVHVHPAVEGPRRPASGKTSPISYDFAYGLDPGPLAEQLSVYTPVPIPYKAPIDWARIATYVGAGLVGLVALRFVAPILQSRWTWAAVTVVTTLIMTSGYMFTRIRGAPFSGPNGQWVAQGYQNQFGQETQVVAMMYGLLGAAFVMLTAVTPYQTSPTRQRMQIYLWSVVIFLMFSVLVSLFRVKNRGYPFKILL